MNNGKTKRNIEQAGTALSIIGAIMALLWKAESKYIDTVKAIIGPAHAKHKAHRAVILHIKDLSRDAWAAYNEQESELYDKAEQRAYKEKEKAMKQGATEPQAQTAWNIAMDEYYYKPERERHQNFYERLNEQLGKEYEKLMNQIPD